MRGEKRLDIEQTCELAVLEKSVGYPLAAFLVAMKDKSEYSGSNQGNGYLVGNKTALGQAVGCKSETVVRVYGKLRALAFGGNDSLRALPSENPRELIFFSSRMKNSLDAMAAKKEFRAESRARRAARIRKRTIAGTLGKARGIIEDYRAWRRQRHFARATRRTRTGNSAVGTRADGNTERFRDRRFPRRGRRKERGNGRIRGKRRFRRRNRSRRRKTKSRFTAARRCRAHSCRAEKHCAETRARPCRRRFPRRLNRFRSRSPKTELVRSRFPAVASAPPARRGGFFLLPSLPFPHVRASDFSADFHQNIEILLPVKTINKGMKENFAKFLLWSLPISAKIRLQDFRGCINAPAA